MAAKVEGSLKTYSKKVQNSSSSAKFDQIFKNKVNVKTTTTRWGQTTFTAVRRQQHDSVNGNDKIAVKKPKVESLPLQPSFKKQNKFFKSRSAADIGPHSTNESNVPSSNPTPSATESESVTERRSFEVERVIERQKRLLKLKQEQFRREMEQENSKNEVQKSVESIETMDKQPISSPEKKLHEESKTNEEIKIENVQGFNNESGFSHNSDNIEVSTNSSHENVGEEKQNESISDVQPTTVEELKPKPIPKKKFFSKSNGDKSKKLQLNFRNFFKSEGANDTILEIDVKESEANDKQSGTNLDFMDDDSEYIKLQRVKKAHQCHELGETEQFDGDIKFYLSGLESCNSISTRCLSILGLANMCQRAEFRMHLRAHDDMPKIISALMDAPSNCNLALCTSALLFVYNQDRLTMDIDPNALSLMLELLETRTDEFSSVEKRHYDKVKELCQNMKQKGYGKYLKLTDLTAGRLSLEALLGLTSKRAGDWFKEELRILKGCDFLMNTVINTCESESDLNDEGQLNKIDRTLRVVENVTFMNEENQKYIITYKSGLFIKTCINLIKFCKNSIINCLESASYLSTLLSVLRIFTNLTSESASGCLAIGSFENIFDLMLEMVFELPSFIVPDSRFELLILLLCLCINLVEFCEPIRESFIVRFSVFHRLIDIFIERTLEAQKTEQQADDLLESHQNQTLTEAMQDSLLNQVLSKSGKHMEHCIIAACIALLIGCGIKENTEAMEMVREQLPDNSFDSMIDVLTKLKEFAHLADIMTSSGVKRVEKILSVFSSLNIASSSLQTSLSLPSETTLDDSSFIKTDVL
ncbi:wings apart-like protein [Dinothrombium tinctorium]|uniref:Wings apart-like protein n=1 Tax=Dinothrombium tinctorium TaxID=1965070 RepID=A0A3S3RYS2_9ACAR|nr:wings apart-like protein [Dinothrombium tinctorium]RWS08006.1 wings apart-like protein [Dinothrombium tinctorium]RWS08090.1 wings apart-like protein [Dinothrombium tinctorium]